MRSTLRIILNCLHRIKLHSATWEITLTFINTHPYTVTHTHTHTHTQSALRNLNYRIADKHYAKANTHPANPCTLNLHVQHTHSPLTDTHTICVRKLCQTTD